MGATADMITNLAAQLGEALTNGPMPDQLVEALNSLREARMNDHRDVLFHNARRVTPRVATSLEDHAMELIASLLGVHPINLADALQRHEALNQASRRIAGQLMATFSGTWLREHQQKWRDLEQRISTYSQGGRLVSLAKAVTLRTEILALPMTDLQRADLEDAFAICTNPRRERQMLEQVWRETCLLRARHRRVRTAINHGLPLDVTTLNSVRVYVAETSRPHYQSNRTRLARLLKILPGLVTSIARATTLPRSPIRPPQC